MTKYIVIERSTDSPVISASGSDEETVCEIATTLMRSPWPADSLMAVAETSAISTFSALKNQALCSLEVTQQTLNTWRRDVGHIRSALRGLDAAKNRAESILESALEDLDEAYGSSDAFDGYVPSDEISVYGVLDDLGVSEVESSFDRALRDMYKFKHVQTQHA